MAQTLLSQHGVHVLAVGVPALMVAGGLTWDAARTRRRDGRINRTVAPHRIAPRVAAIASAAAAAVHLAVMPGHFGESVLYGAFFAGAAAAQLGGAWMLWSLRSRSMYALAAAGNAAVIALWLATRLLAIPIGPGAGTTERFGRLDITASVCEAVVVATCLACLRGTRRVRARTPAHIPASPLADVA